MIAVKNKYNIALNDIGLVLQGVPTEPSYLCEPAPIFQNRFAQGDRTYDDFSKWWYWAQTDWSNGFKNSVSWVDDGQFYYSTNIDAYSEAGAFKLAKKQELQNTFTETLECGIEGEVNGTTYKFVGTDDNASSKPVIYQYSGGSWSDISSTQITTNQNVISQILTRQGILWGLTVGVGNTNAVLSWTGSAWTDQSSYIMTAMGWSAIMGSRGGCESGNNLYVLVDDPVNNKEGVVYCSKANPTASGDWTKLFEKSTDGIIVDITAYGGNLYYLLAYSYYAELRCWNLSSSADSLIYTFKNTNFASYGLGGRMLLVHNGKLVVTVPTKEIWSWDGTNMSRILRLDDEKQSLGSEAYASIYKGGVISDNKVFWGNLVYDGTRFYNWIKETADGTNYYYYPLFVDSQDIIYGTDQSNSKKLYNQSSSYKGTADKNFIVFSNFDKVSGIDKFAYSVTLNFKKLISGQKIVVEYLTDELTSSSTWSVLGNASYTDDGGSVTTKTLYFPANTTFKKIWIRVKLEAGGSDTPVVKDLITAYLPRPYADKRWRVNINCGDSIELLSGEKQNQNGREIKNKIEQAWLLNQIVDFQDVDYATTTLSATLTAGATTATVTDTSDFPEAGRLKIEDEIIYYTGKTRTTFTGLLRGQKGTKAVQHASTTVVNNGYKVFVESVVSQVPIMNHPDSEKKLEYVVGVVMREVV